MADARGGWRQKNGHWVLGNEDRAPDPQPPTAEALARREAEAGAGHDPWCRCKQCFGNARVAKPGSERCWQRRLRAKRPVTWQVVPSNNGSEVGEPDWAQLGPTDRFLRKQTWPGRHALADGPRRTAAAAFARLAPGQSLLRGLPEGDVEAWQLKWARELEFVDTLGADLTGFAPKAQRPCSRGSSSSHAPSAFGFGLVPSGSRPPRTPRPTSAVSVSSRASTTASSCQWATYNATWAHQEGQLGTLRGVRAADVPWPPKGNVCGIRPGDGKDVRRQKLRSALLRWHPDKWHAALDASSDRGELGRRLAEVTQQILREKGAA